MTEFMVQLTSVSQIKSFVNVACMQNFDVCIVDGRHLVDAKSIMAVFSLELSKPLHVKAECGKEECADFRNAIEEFILSEPETTQRKGGIPCIATLSKS